MLLSPQQWQLLKNTAYILIRVCLKRISYPRFFVVSENKTRKSPSFFKQKCTRNGSLQTTFADVYFTTEGWGSIHTCIMNLYKMQSCSVSIPNRAYVRSFVSLSFCLDESVLNNLLALLVQWNKLNATAGEGCRLKHETEWTYRCVLRECHYACTQSKIHLIPRSQIILYQRHNFTWHYNSRYKKWPQNHRTSNDITLRFYTCTFVSSYTADAEWGVCGNTALYLQHMHAAYRSAPYPAYGENLQMHMVR